jgi:rifampin ADP-ribosylating transferase
MNKTSVNNNKTIYYHGTKADLKKGDLIKIGYHSNYGKKKQILYIFLLQWRQQFGEQNLHKEIC